MSSEKSQGVAPAVTVDSGKQRTFKRLCEKYEWKRTIAANEAKILQLLPWYGAFSLWCRKGKAFVNVHLHCIVGNMKRISKMSTLFLPGKISADAHSQDYIMRDDLAIDSSLSIVVKKIKITQYVCQKQHRLELLEHFWRQVRYTSN